MIPCKPVFAGIVLALTLAPLIAHAVGETTAPSMAMPTSMRSYGMGETGVADDSDPGNAFYNPAIISSFSGVFASGGYSNLIPMLSEDVRLTYTGILAGFQEAPGRATRLGAGGSVEYVRLNLGEWTGFSPAGDTVQPYESFERYFRASLAGGFTFARSVRIGVGASLKHWRWAWKDSYSDLSCGWDAWAGDAGLLMRITGDVKPGLHLAVSSGFSYLSFGHHVRIGGSKVPLPTTMRLGVGFRLEANPLEELKHIFGYEPRMASIAAYLDVIDNRHSHDRPIVKWGAELSFIEMLHFRIGYVNDKPGRIEDLTWGFGLGIRLRNLMGRFDYARRPLAEDLGHENKYGGVVGFVW